MSSTLQLEAQPIFENGIWRGSIKPPFEQWRIFKKLFLEKLRMFPCRVGQIDALTGEKDTYSAIADRIVRCALWLKSQNLQKDDIVGICSYNHLDTIVPLVASILCGVIFNPWWNANLDNDLAKQFLNLTKPKIVFADENTVHIIKEAVNEVGADVSIIVFKDEHGFQSLRDIMAQQNYDEVTKFECHNLDDLYEPIAILYTSGTTGYPKGAFMPYGWLMGSYRSLETPAVNFWSSTICWGTGLVSTLDNLLTCSTAVVCSELTVKGICEIIEKYKITQMRIMTAGWATRLHRFEHTKSYDLSSIKVLVVGGSFIHVEVDAFLRETFKNAYIIAAYGATEIGGICARFKRITKFGSCGQVFKNARIKVIDPETGKILGANEEEEICVKALYMMLHYYNNPKSTAEVIDKDGWFHTGDLGYYDDDGDFYVTDRQKELIKLGDNTHVSPNAIESIILKHPGVFEVGVVAKPHPTDIEQPMAFISRRPNANVSEDDIIKLVKENASSFMQLTGGVVILDELPHIESGKIGKRELRRMAKSLASI